MAESVTYDTRILTYPDGTKQLYKSSRRYHRKGDEEKERESLFDMAYAEYLDVPSWIVDAMKAPDLDADSASSSERKEIDHMKRAVQTVYNLAKSNHFDYFVTFTLNPAVVDVYDYDSCLTALSQWTNAGRKRGLRWLIVPEQHKSLAYHFHGLVAGTLKLVPAVNPHTGTVLFDRSGRMIYNVGDYQWGYTTATEITDSKRTASYLAKYLSKDIVVPKGRQRYLASKSLIRPAEDLCIMSDMDFVSHISTSRYFKEIQNDWGKFWLCETEKA